MNIQHIHGVPPLYTNTFLIITNAKHGILIDAAAEPGVYLKALDEAGATLTHILLTHGHYDHVGAVAALKKATGCKVYMDPVDAQGSQLLPLTPDVLTDNWPANDELTIDPAAPARQATLEDCPAPAGRRPRVHALPPFVHAAGGGHRQHTALGHDDRRAPGAHHSRHARKRCHGG